MASSILVDTDIAVDYLRGFNLAIAFLEKADAVFHLSSITVAELYAGVREGKERPALEEFVKAFTVVPISHDIAKRGGLYRRNFGKTRGVGLADAIIAATAEHIGAELASLNKKHFPMLKNIVVPYSKS